MDFWQTILVVFRRWYVALPAFLLSILAALGVYASVPRTYVSTSVLVLTLPTTGSSQPADLDRPRDQINPLLNFDKGLSTSATILIQAISTPETAAELGVPPGSDTWFEVTNGSSNPELLITGPFIFIQGNSSTAAGAVDIVRKVEERARVEVVQPTEPEAKGGSRIRSAGAAFALALFLSLAATYAFESVMQVRGRRAKPKDDHPEAALEPSLQP
jgi:hypothetical protein